MMTKNLITGEVTYELNREETIKIMEFFLHKQCDLGRMKNTPYDDDNLVWEAVNKVFKEWEQSTEVDCETNENEIVDDELEYLAEAIDQEWAEAIEKEIIYGDYHSRLAKWLEELSKYKALGKIDDLVSREEILQARPENLNPSMYDDLLSAEHEGWNACNEEWYNLIKDFRR